MAPAASRRPPSPPRSGATSAGHAFYPPKTALDRIPALYDTDGTPLEHKTIHAHYFAAWGDWYVAELDPATGEAFGWARLGADDTQGEWGYMDLPALESFRKERGLPHFVERDLHFDPQAAADCLPKGRRVHRCRDGACTICPPRTITVADLAAELGTTVMDISRRISALCRELGSQQVVHTAVAVNARCVLHGKAADMIRAQVTQDV